MSLDLTIAKTLIMVSIGKVAFNIDGLMIHSMLNILVQQSLSSLPNLLFDTLNRLMFTSIWVKQLNLIYEISFVHVRMFNVIDHRLRSIKYSQNNFSNGLDIIMKGGFYQTPPWKIVGSFRISWIMH
jgi:hypothetical protein